MGSPCLRQQAKPVRLSASLAARSRLWEENYVMLNDATHLSQRLTASAIPNRARSAPP
jgi:hypothetical protein